jgi:hypothetical protein
VAREGRAIKDVAGEARGALDTMLNILNFILS